MSVSTVLILGGSCFVGRQLVDSLLAEGKYRVITLNRGNVYWNDKTRRPTVVSVDRRKNRTEYAEQVRDILISCSPGKVAVIDFCAYRESDIRKSLPEFFWTVNKYILISSDSTYECVSDLADDRIIRETDTDSARLVPELDTYGYNKLMCERAVNELASQSTTVVHLRLPDIIGPFDDTLRFWGFVTWIRSGVPVYLSNPATPISVVYSHDVVRFIMGILSREQIPSGPVNIACIEQIPIKDFFDLIATPVDTTQEAPRKEYLPSIERRKTPLDLSRMNDIFKFAPTKLVDVIRETCAWLDEARSRFPGEYSEMVDDLPRMVRRVVKIS
jgi:nucleoside-diphosphate-sugar epimerase